MNNNVIHLFISKNVNEDRELWLKANDIKGRAVVVAHDRVIHPTLSDRQKQVLQQST